MPKHHEDLLIITNPTDEPFVDKWAGVERTVQPGQQLIWPRYIAEHYAKHLADKMLMRMERDHKNEFLEQPGNRESDYKPKSFLNSAKHRPEVIKKIILGIYQPHIPNANDEQLRIQRQIDEVNNGALPKEKDIDIGEEHDPLLGNLQPDRDDPKAPVALNPQLPTNGVPLPPAIAGAPVQTGPVQPPVTQTGSPLQLPVQQPDESPADKLARLRAEADQLGIDYPKTANTKQLEKLLMEFAG